MELVPYKRGPTELMSPSPNVKTQREGTGYEPGKGSSPKSDHAGALIPDFPTSRAMRKNFCYKLHSRWYFIIAA